MIAVREDIQRSIIPIRRIEVFLAQDIEGRALGEQCQAAGEPGRATSTVSAMVLGAVAAGEMAPSCR